MPINSNIYNKGNITPFAEQLGAVQQRELENQLAMQRSQQLAQAQQLQMDKFASGSNLPAAVQEYEYFKNLSPEEQDAYSGLRGRTNITDLGDRFVIVDRASGMQREIMKNSPEGMQITASQGGGMQQLTQQPIQQPAQQPALSEEMITPEQLTGTPDIGFQEETLPGFVRPETVFGGQKGIPPTETPDYKRESISAQEQAKLITAAQASIPNVIENAVAIDTAISDLYAMPGLPKIFGKQGLLPNVPAGEAADALAKFNNISGKLFANAYETLKGGGTITEVETREAKNALLSMETAQSLAAWKQAVQRFQEARDRGIRKLQDTATGKVFEKGYATGAVEDYFGKQPSPAEKARIEFYKNKNFNSEEAVEKLNLPSGTIVTINGRKARVK